MLAKWRCPKPGMALFFLILFLSLAGCGQNAGEGRQGEADVAAPQASPNRRLNRLPDVVIDAHQARDSGYLDLQRIDFPEGTWPMGMQDSRFGYLLDAEQARTLWSFDYIDGSRVVVLEAYDAGVSFGREMVFDDQWLVWMELSPLEYPAEGLPEQSVLLKARNVASGDEDVTLDYGRVRAADGFHPFDCLTLDDGLLTYRFSEWDNGWRNSAVRLMNLAEGEGFTLATEQGRLGRMILRCHAEDNSVVWDTQVAYQRANEGSPSVASSYYELHLYRYAEGQTVFDPDAHRSVTLFERYYAPFLYRGTILATELMPTRLDDLGYDSAIVQINPEFQTVQRLVYDYPYSRSLLDAYQQGSTPRGIFRDRAYVGQQFLSWQSNVSEHHLLFDFSTYRFIELPALFWQLTGESADGFWAEPLLGLDADYLLFGLASSREDPYILRIARKE